MTCGGESIKEKITGDSEVSWLISYYDFRVGRDPLSLKQGGHTPFLNHNGEILSLVQVVGGSSLTMISELGVTPPPLSQRKRGGHTPK